MKPPARAIAGNVIWSTDGGVWVVWRCNPFPSNYATLADRFAAHARIRGALMALPANSMLFSVCEALDGWDVVADMIQGVDLNRHPTWAESCNATGVMLESQQLYRRRFYVAAELADRQTATPWRDALSDAWQDIACSLGCTPSRVDDDELDTRRRQANALRSRLATHLQLTNVTTGEIRWLYARALRRAAREPTFDDTWEPPAANKTRANAVLLPLTDAIIKEGGYRDDPDRPRHHRYVRVDAGEDVSYQAFLVVADMPHEFRFPGGAGEWLHHVDDIGTPIDWCVRVHSVPNADAQLKVRRQHRQLIGQVDEYDGEVTGAPPSLAEAIQAVDDQRASLAANPAEPELQATLILSVAAEDLVSLEEQCAAITALFEPHEYGIHRPTGGQAALLRSALPGTKPAPVCRDYTQFLLSGDLAAGAPFSAATVGDPQGLFLGFSLDSGTPSPVLFDPTYGPSVGRTASLAAIGALGSGKSFLLKRLCWDTVARGGQVVTIDRTAVGEYVKFAQIVPGRPRVIDLSPDSDVSLDPLRSFVGDDRINVTLGFLSLLAGCSTHSEEGAALTEAVHRIADQHDPNLSAVVDELTNMGQSRSQPDPAARGLARRLDHYRRVGIGRLAFSNREPLDLEADLIVFWAPHLALPDRDTLVTERLARQMLPEEVVGLALLYLIAAVGRRVVFSDPSRFGAALYDEAWVLLASPHGQRLVLEGVRDGRKHNGAIWLASQHPHDLGAPELVDLLGARFVFRQSHGAIDLATEFLGVPGSVDAAEILRKGLATGRCLYRDVHDRVGLTQIAPPAIAVAHRAADTTPRRNLQATPPAPRSLNSHQRPRELGASQGSGHVVRGRRPPTSRPSAVRRGGVTPLAKALAAEDTRT